MSLRSDRIHRHLLARSGNVLRLCTPGFLLIVLLTIGVSLPADAHGSAIMKPGAPTGVTALPGNGSALVSWTAPVSNGGSPVTGYTVTASGQSCATTVTTCTVTGLTNGHLYKVRVRASNVKGEGHPGSTKVRPTASPPKVSFDGNSVFTYPSEEVAATLSARTSNTVQVDFTTSGGPSAVLYWGAWTGAASSFSPSSGIITFAPGQTTATIPFTVDPTTVSGCDPLADVPCYPSVTVTLSNPSNAVIGSTPDTNVFYAPA
jgi:hypothetical protein